MSIPLRLPAGRKRTTLRYGLVILVVLALVIAIGRYWMRAPDRVGDTVSSEALKPSEASVEVSAPGHRDAADLGSAWSARLQVTVRQLNGRRVSGCRVEATAPDGTKTSTACDGAGTCGITAVKSGQYRLSTVGATTALVDVCEQTDYPVELVISDSVELDMMVVDVLDRPVSNALILATSERPQQAVTADTLAKTDHEGRCIVRCLPTDWISARHEDYCAHPYVLASSLRSDGERTVFVLRPGSAKLRVIVQGTGGECLSGCDVELLAIGLRQPIERGIASNQVPRTATTDKTGTVVFDGCVPNLEYQVRVRGGASHCACSWMAAINEVMTEVRLIIPVGIDVEGKVVDSAGRPIANAEVEEHGANRHSVTDESGRFRLVRCATWRQTASKENRWFIRLVAKDTQGRWGATELYLSEGALAPGMTIRLSDGHVARVAGRVSAPSDEVLDKEAIRRLYVKVRSGQRDYGQTVVNESGDFSLLCSAFGGEDSLTAYLCMVGINGYLDRAAFDGKSLLTLQYSSEQSVTLDGEISGSDLTGEIALEYSSGLRLTQPVRAQGHFAFHAVPVGSVRLRFRRTTEQRFVALLTLDLRGDHHCGVVPVPRTNEGRVVLTITAPGMIGDVIDFRVAELKSGEVADERQQILSGTVYNGRPRVLALPAGSYEFSVGNGASSVGAQVQSVEVVPGQRTLVALRAAKARLVSIVLEPADSGFRSFGVVETYTGAVCGRGVILEEERTVALWLSAGVYRITVSNSENMHRQAVLNVPEGVDPLSVTCNPR